MNVTVKPEKNRKRGVYQYFQAALPFRVASSDFHTFSYSKDLVNTKVSSPKEPIKQPAMKENSVRRPGFLRLDSQGESSKNGWVNDSSGVVNVSSRNDRTSALFSDIFRRYPGICESQSMNAYCHKPQQVKPYDHCFNITAAIKPFCEQSNFLLLCRQKNSSLADLGDVLTVQALHCGPHVLPNCTNEAAVIQQSYRKPVEFVSSLPPADNKNTFWQELQYGFNIAPLRVRSLTAVPQHFVDDLLDCGSTLKQGQHVSSVNHLSRISFTSSEAVSNGCAVETRQLHHQSRLPRFNCKRKWLHVSHNLRHRKPPALSCATVSTGIDESASASELLERDPDNDHSECDIHESKWLSADGRHVMPEFLSSFDDLVTPCMEDSALWVNTYCSQLSLPSSVCSMHIHEPRSFACSLFASGTETDSSDFCCTDSDESDCSELSPSSVYRTGDVIPEYLLPGLPCLHVPFTDNWVLGFSDCTSASPNSDFEVCFEEDSIYIPGNEAVCNYFVGVEEANIRWNEAYSFSADVLSKSQQHHNRMV